MRTIAWFLTEYIFYYPLIMSIVWISGGIMYFYRMKTRNEIKCPVFEQEPFVSVLVPARNEGSQIRETIMGILGSNYSNFEVVVINDASTDETKEIVEGFMGGNDKIRLLNLEENMGKATALNYGLLVSKGEIIVTIDADCSLDKNCIPWLVSHFVHYPRVGAVTGNPRVKNQKRLLTRVQAAEYSSIIGLVKRSQRMLGKLFTVSGVVAAFSRRALLDAGLWSDNMLTEDIDITWKMEGKFWDVRYEERAICSIVTPQTVRGLLKQRFRWCGGGAQVIKKQRSIWKKPEMRRMWPIYIDYILSIIWAYAFITCCCFWILQAVFYLITGSSWSALGNPIPYWRGAMIAIICIFQLLVGIVIDRDFKEEGWGTYFYAIWFPVAYWFLHSISAVAATPGGLFKKFDKPAIWVSPERGEAAAGGFLRK